MSDEIEPAAVLRTDKGRIAVDIGNEGAQWKEPGISWKEPYASITIAQKVSDAVGLDVPMEPLVRVSDVVRQLDKILSVPRANENDTVEDRVNQFRNRLRDMAENDSGLKSQEGK